MDKTKERIHLEIEQYIAYLTKLLKNHNYAVHPADVIDRLDHILYGRS